MQAANQGLISTTLARLVPFSNFLEKTGLRPLVTRVTTYAIRDYQRYISPKKGFSCAHRYFYGGESCSEHFRLLVTSYGLSEAVPLFQQRLQDCRQAHSILKNRILKMSIANEDSNLEEPIASDAPNPEENADELKQPEKQPPKASESSSSSLDGCGDALSSCNCGDFELPHWEACDRSPNHTSNPGECNGIDLPCDGIDLSCDGFDSCNCDGCEISSCD